MVQALTVGCCHDSALLAIDCRHDNEGLFVGGVVLLALDGGPLSFPS
jgi:hypothetical protein